MALSTDKLKPDWAGDDLLARVVNLLIKTKPIYRIMQRQARRVLINTAEKMGYPGAKIIKIWKILRSKTY